MQYILTMYNFLTIVVFFFLNSTVLIIWGHPKIMNLKFLKRVYIKFRRSSNACSLNWYSTHHWRIIHRLNESSITPWCNEDYILKLKKNFVLMNNLVNIAEFSKKQTHQKHITWKATLYNSWIKTITGLWTHYSVRTKRYKMDPFIILYPA